MTAKTLEVAHAGWVGTTKGENIPPSKGDSVSVREREGDVSVGCARGLAATETPPSACGAFPPLIGGIFRRKEDRNETKSFSKIKLLCCRTIDRKSSPVLWECACPGRRRGFNACAASFLQSRLQSGLGGRRF